MEEKSRRLGTTLNYQIIDLFEIAESCKDFCEFENKKEEYFKTVKEPINGIEKVSFLEIMNIKSNIVERCKLITPEGEGKLKFLLKENGENLFDGDKFVKKDIFNFEYLDKVINFAKKNNMKVRFHTVVWHESFPDILNSANKKQTLSFLGAFMDEIVSRYGEEIFYSVDVLNEIAADKDTVPTLRDSKWKDKLGDEYFIDVLNLAREKFPNTNLAYNEYDEWDEKKREKMIRIISIIKEHEKKTGKKLLDSIGLQNHYIDKLSLESIREGYKKLYATGKKVEVTELDIIKTGKSEEEFKNFISNILKSAKSSEVENFTFWGPSSNVSWKRGEVSTFLDGRGNLEESMIEIVNEYAKKEKCINGDEDEGR